MSDDLLVVGVSHHSCPVSVREELAVPAESLSENIADLRELSRASELFVLSTCNRVEVYAVGDKTFAVEQIRAALSKLSAQAQNYIYAKDGTDALHHLFQVASSLDSMVVGEPQILGQLKAAFEAARQTGAIGTFLGRSVESAYRVAKRVRSETKIAEGTVSMSSIATELAERIFGDLSTAHVLLIGAGKMSESAAKSLVQRGARLRVLNRSPERAKTLAQSYGGSAGLMADLEKELVSADIVIASTGSETYVVTAAMAESARKKRRYRPLFFIDISVPRNVDPAVGALEEVYVYDVDDLRGIAEEHLRSRQDEAHRANAIVLHEVAEFRRWQRSAAIGPTLVRVREGLEERVRSELVRTTLLSGDELERAVHGVCGKILHPLTRALKEAFESGDRKSIEVLLRASGLSLDNVPEPALSASVDAEVPPDDALASRRTRA